MSLRASQAESRLVSRPHAGSDEPDHLERREALLSRLAANTRRVRDAKGMSQERLAEAVGCAATYIQRIEAAAANPTMSFVAALAHGLSVDVSELFQPCE